MVPPALKIKLNKLQKSNFTNYRNNFNFDGAVGGYIRCRLEADNYGPLTISLIFNIDKIFVLNMNISFEILDIGER